MTGVLTLNRVVLRFLQYFIAIVLLMTGVGKLLDVPGFMDVLVTYRAFPEWSLPFIAIGLIVTELKISGQLFFGKHLILASLASLVLHLIFTAWASLTLLRGLDIPNCGCFGVFLARPLTKWTVVEDLVMVAASLWLFLLARERHAAKSL